MSSNEFLAALVRNPRQIGAIVPSGHALATAMAEQVVNKNSYVLELGPGTGVITKALLAHGVKPEHLFLLEKDAHMAQRLRSTFDNLNILCGDATKSSGLLKASGVDQVASIVSSLPLLNIPLVSRFRILKNVLSILKNDGNFIQFTYSPLPPISKRLSESLNIKGQRKKFIIRNIPPAFIWEYKKESQ
ncbi:MAG: phospholipid methyltransferase [Gammaproteobacteria bacterium]|nr:phospholipid methyltransferase [Gammaproteobacteria bacterium]